MSRNSQPGRPTSLRPISLRPATANTSSGDDDATTTMTTTSEGRTTTPDKTKENPIHASGFQLYAIVGVMTMLMFVTLLDVSVVGTAIPYITSDFHSVSATGWYAATYTFATSAVQPLTGKIYSNFSAKWTLLIFFLVFNLGSLLCGAATSSTMLIVGRAVAGLGSSGLNNGSMTIIAGATPLEKRPIYMGMILGVGQIGNVSGPLLGGVLTQFASWRWCFYINLPIGAIIAGFLIFLHVPELTVKPAFSWRLLGKILRRNELDLVGFSLFAPAAVMLLLALELGGNQYPWASSVVIGLFVGSFFTFCLFFYWESRVGDDKAMIDLKMVRQRIVWSSALNMSLLVVSIIVISSFLPTYFQAVKGDKPSMSGVSMIPSIISQLILAIGSGVIVSKIGYYLPLVVLGNCLILVGTGLLTTLSPTTTTGQWVGYQIIIGLGRGMGLQMGVIAVQNTVQAFQIPVAMAFMVFCQNFSGAIFTVVGTAIFTNSLFTNIPKYAPSVSPEAAASAGSSAEAVRALLPEGSSELPGLLMAYSKSIDNIFYMLVACGGIALLAGFGMGWKDTRKKTPVPDASGERGEETPASPIEMREQQPGDGQAGHGQPQIQEQSPR